MDVLGIVIAGGREGRLYPLTRDQAKPAVPFGGKYRSIDFVLSNLVNSDIRSVYVLTQFKLQPLLQHLEQGWRFGDFTGDRSIASVPAQMRTGDDRYRGNSRFCPPEPPPDPTAQSETRRDLRSGSSVPYEHPHG